MATWTVALELNARREITAGSDVGLRDAIRRGADLRIYTEFRHNEHLDVTSRNSEIVREVADFRVTYLVDDHWVAGIMTLRLPINPPVGFGPRPSMSFFMYNQNGQQAIARPYLDGVPAAGTRGPAPVADHADMPKYHQADAWDAETNAPSHNFSYDFEVYRFLVCDEWRELLSHTPDGHVISGSFDTLAAAFAGGHEIKVAIRGLCADLAAPPAGCARPRIVYSTRSRLPGHGAEDLLGRQPSAGARGAGGADAVSNRQLGFRLADAAQRWFHRPLVVRSLSVGVR
jgi:hypothetical protein